MENRDNNRDNHINNVIEENNFPRSAMRSISHTTPVDQFTSTTSGMLRWASRGVRRARAHPAISSPSPWATIQIRTREVCFRKCNIIMSLYIHISS